MATNSSKSLKDTELYEVFVLSFMKDDSPARGGRGLGAGFCGGAFPLLLAVSRCFRRREHDPLFPVRGQFPCLFSRFLRLSCV